MSVLFSWLSIPRWICIWIDGIAFSLIDDFYEIIVAFSKGTLLKQGYVLQFMQNVYIIIGIFALFRLALLLVNAIINPDRLTEEGKGISKIAVNVLIMFVLLVAVPIIFRNALEIQDKVVSGNYIQKLFLKNADLDDDKNKPGRTMQSIAISALINVDSEIWKDKEKTNVDSININNYEDNVVSACTSNCKKAVAEWLTERDANYFQITKLSNHIGTSIKIDGETVYVYHYYVIVTLIVAILILWVLGSFGFEIAMRMVELTVLQILSPLFIATIVDPKSMKSGPFNNWLKAVGKSYASLFIRLAILSLMLLFVQIIGNIKHYSNLHLGPIETVVLLIAILMFAKKAPKWITSMIGISDANGMGLLTPKKIKENMAGLGAMRTAAAIGGSLAGNATAVARDNIGRAKAVQNAIKKKEKELGRSLTKDEKGKIRKQHHATFPGTVFRTASAISNAIKKGKEVGKNAGSLGDALRGSAEVTANFRQAKGIDNDRGLITKAGKVVKGIGERMTTAAWGSGADIYDAQKAAKKQEKLENFYTRDAINKLDGRSEKLTVGDAILGAGDIEKLKTDPDFATPRDFGDLMAMSYAKAIGGSAKYDANGDLVVKGANGAVIATNEAIQKGRAMYTDEGIANMHQVYNSFQQNSLSEQASNAQLMNQLTSSISAMSDQLRNIKINNLNNNELTLGDGSKIGLDKKSIDSLSEAQRTIHEKIATEQDPSKKAALQQNLTEVSQVLTFERQMQSSVAELSSLQARQDELAEISKGINFEFDYDENGEFVSKEKKAYEEAIQSGDPVNLKFVTTEQKQQYLATKAGDYEKEVKFAEEQRKKKKGESDK